jgi:hypothetical protein
MKWIVVDIVSRIECVEVQHGVDSPVLSTVTSLSLQSIHHGALLPNHSILIKHNVKQSILLFNHSIHLRNYSYLIWLLFECD